MLCSQSCFLLLFPVRLQMRDGETVHYDAILYDVYDVHRLLPLEDPNEDVGYYEGVIVEILGIEVFNNTEPHLDVHN